MIKSDGTKVICSGSGIELLQDFVNVMKSVRSILTERFGEEVADEVIAVCGRYTYADSDAEEDMYLERLAEIIMGREVSAN